MSVAHCENCGHLDIDHEVEVPADHRNHDVPEFCTVKGCKCYGNYQYLAHAKARTEGELTGETVKV